MVPAIAAVTAALILFIIDPEPRRLLAVLVLITVLLLALWFFRDPDRIPDPRAGSETVLAPADGAVVALEEGDGGCSLSIYLSLLDVHVVRLPCAGTVKQIIRSAGRHHRAGSRKAGGNASVEIGIVTGRGEMTLRLVSGLLARRIVTYLAPDEKGAAGMRAGLIRFGSRVDLSLPVGFQPVVGIGTRVRAGVTIVAVPRQQPSRLPPG